MLIDITGRHIDVTQALREFTEDKLRKLERLLEGPLEAHVVLGIEKHRHSAEIQVKARHATLSGAEVTGDLYSSIGEVVDKLERQALKHKEKTRGHKHRQSPRDPRVAAVVAANAAAADPEASAPVVALPRIVRSENYRLKPMSPEDAVLELEAGSEDVLVFRDADSDRINVLFRKADGNYGLIDPEF